MNIKYLVRSNRLLGNKRNIKLYIFLVTIPVYLYHSLATKDYWTILFIACLALYAPILWTACALFLCYKTHTQFRQSHLTAIENIQGAIVQFMQSNQLQKLSEIIDANPEVLYCDYQRRSLIAWCRYYKNTHAQELIIQLMKKYPKDAIAA
ncbi:MAG: hypothetical protein WC635_07620 [Bacteriovorax sp.]|jgi:hypothetical protein